MVEIEKFNGSWKVVPTAIPFPLSNDAVAILLHLIGKSKWKSGFMPDEPIPISKNELTKLTDKCWKKIGDSIQELVDFNFVSEFKHQPTAPSCIVINWEEIWKLQQIVSKISTLGRIELRKKMRKNGFTAFSKLSKNDIDEILNKYAYNQRLEAEENTNNIKLPSNQRLEASNHRLEAYDERLEASNHRLEAYDERLEASHRRLEAYNQRLEAYDERLEAYDHRLEASNDLSYVLDKISALVHDVCTKDMKLAEISQNTIISCVEKLSQLLTTDHKLLICGHKLLTTDHKLDPELLTCGHNSNKYIYKYNKISNNERSELYKGENKEKVEIEEELGENRELPDNNKNSSDSFLGNFLGEGFSDIQETSSNENISDENISGEHSQEIEEPVWREFRNLDFPAYEEQELSRILFQVQNDEVERAVSEIASDLQEYDSYQLIESIPANELNRLFENYVNDKKAQDENFQLTELDLANMFAFEPFWDNGQWNYHVSSSKIKNIAAEEKRGGETETVSKRSDGVSRNEYFSSVLETGNNDDSQLSDMEYVLYRLLSSLRSGETRKDFPGSRNINGRVECPKKIFWMQIDSWGKEANLSHDEVAWMFEKFKVKASSIHLQISKIDYRKILEWNRNNDKRNAAEELWKRKMADIQE